MRGSPEKIWLGSSVGNSLKSPKLVADLYQPWSGQVTLSTSVKSVPNASRVGVFRPAADG